MRPLALALVLSLAGCSAVPDTIVCEHCACYAADRSVRRPVLCSTVARNTCCLVLPTS